MTKPRPKPWSFASALLAALALALALVIVGCGGTIAEPDGEPAPGGPSQGARPANTAVTKSCDAAMHAICDRACACGEPGRCSILSSEAAGLMASEHYESKAKCLEHYGPARCASADPSTDFVACVNAVGSAACTPLPTGRPMSAFAMPEVCIQ